MEMVKAVNLKKYYITDTYEVHALDGVSLSASELPAAARRRFSIFSEGWTSRHPAAYGSGAAV